MSWYTILKFLHILAVSITVGGMFARQLVRGIARKSDDVKIVASLTQAGIRIDRAMVIPWSNLILLIGIPLALIGKWPILGFFQGAAENWLLVSNILLVIMIALVPMVFLPHNKKVAGILQAALAEGRITPELSASLADKKDRLAHHAEEVIILAIAALMVLKPF
jgi:uncharacterized membrane protein